MKQHSVRQAAKAKTKFSCEDNNAVALFSELLSDGNRVYLFHDIDSFRLNLLEIRLIYLAFAISARVSAGLFEK